MCFCLHTLHSYVSRCHVFGSNFVKSSNKIAQEKSACAWFDRTKYADGILPIDTYKDSVDELVKPKYNMDWEGLRKRIKENGLRHSTLTAQMPSESSSVVSNATNGIEPPRALVSYKQSKDGVMAQVVPGYHHLKNKYDLLWDQESPDGYLKICAILSRKVCSSACKILR